MHAFSHKGIRPLILACLMMGCAQNAVADAVTHGTLVSRDEQGQKQDMPLVSTRVAMEITGSVLRAQVTQVFHNPTDNWAEALYLFPLPGEAAVDHLKMQIGDRIIEGDIQEKEQARATYEQAKSQGQNAALTEQDRPNLFHTSVANIPPGGEVTISIEYQQTLVWKDGRFSAGFPLAITPRYNPVQPAEVRRVVEGQATLSSGWQVLPGERKTVMATSGDDDNAVSNAPGPVEISLSLQPGFRLSSLDSPSHQISQKQTEDGRYLISLLADEPDDYRDFVLNWTPVESAEPSAAFFSEQHGDEHYGLLMLMPPQDLHTPRYSREVVFVIDTSGSMAGTSIEAARRALQAGIDGLASDDTFNVIQFNSSTDTLFNQPVIADIRRRQQAASYINSLQAGGGTEMAPALTAALSGIRSNDDTPRLRQIVFITDGSVSNEQQLFDLIRSRLDNTRLFTVGIGSAPNSYFMEEAAVAGRGTFTYIASPSESESSMQMLFSKLEKPAMTDIRIEGDGIKDLMPSVIPDLYSGEPLAVSMKLANGTGEVRISGRTGDAAWQETLTLAPADNTRGIMTDWAQRAVQDWRRGYLRGVSEEQIRSEIIALGLKYHLVTPYTSLVAVDKTPVRPEQEGSETLVVPAAKPHGLDLGMAQGATGYQLPLAGGLAALLAALSVMIVQRRRKSGSRWCA